MPSKRTRTSNDDPLGLGEVNIDLSEFANDPTSSPVKPTTARVSTRSEKPAPPQHSPQKLTSQQVNKSTGQLVEKISEEPSPVVIEQTEPSSQPEKLESQKVDLSVSSKVDKSTSQQEQLPTLELKKATFQLDKAVLTKLEKLVLGLQLELGKENAPYKEVIVEEALERFLNQEPSKFLKALERRQKKRK